MMCTKNERLDSISTSTSPRIESVFKRSGSFADSIILPSPYPRQELQSDSFLLGRVGDSDYGCDSLSSGSGSGSDHDDNDDDDDSKEYWTGAINRISEKDRALEPSFCGSFAESVSPQRSPQRTKYPQSCLIPSLPNTPEESSMEIMADNIPPPTPLPQCSLSMSFSSSTPRRQLFFRESNSNLISQEEQEIEVSTVQHPPSPPPIPSNSNTTHKSNSTININDDRLIQENTDIHSTVEWLQSTTECYGNAHLHTVLPVVLEEEEGGAISSSPDQYKQKHKNCESKSESDSKIESDSKKELELNTIPIPIPITKTRNFCSSTNGESLHTILSIHNSYHDDHDNNNHHSNNHPLKVDPTTDTIGSDTYQTQSISNNSSFSTFSKDLEISPNPNTPTNTHDHDHNQDNNHHHRHTHHLEEELDSRLEVIMALKDVVLDQNRASKKVTRENRKITSKLASKTKANRKLNGRNRTLEEQVEALQRELGEMKARVVEVEHDLGEERRWNRRRELGLQLGEGLGGEEEKDDEIFDDCGGGGYIYHRNSDQASF